MRGYYAFLKNKQYRYSFVCLIIDKASEFESWIVFF